MICPSCGVLLGSNVGATCFENNESEKVVTYEAFFMTVTIRVYTARPETQWANMKCKKLTVREKFHQFIANVFKEKQQ